MVVNGQVVVRPMMYLALSYDHRIVDGQGAVTFLVKVTLMCFVYVWVRWTLPRFRYDQLQRLGWQTLIPLSLLNIFVTSAVVIALS